MLSDDLLLQEEIIFIRKELDNKQRIIETLLQKSSENVRPIQQVENNTFNNDVDVTNECKLMKEEHYYQILKGQNLKIPIII